jgi:hypothetical protein
VRRADDRLAAMDELIVVVGDVLGDRLSRQGKEEERAEGKVEGVLAEIPTIGDYFAS